MNILVSLATLGDDGLTVTLHNDIVEAEQCLVDNFGEPGDTVATIYDSMEYHNPGVIYSIIEHEVRN